MSIPDEAVEAAAKAAYNMTHRTQWVQLSVGYKRELMVPARAALEAATPHMLAAAWDEGCGAGWNDCLLDMQKRGILSANPYGSAS